VKRSLAIRVPAGGFDPGGLTQGPVHPIKVDPVIAESVQEASTPTTQGGKFVIGSDLGATDHAGRPYIAGICEIEAAG